MESPNKFEEIVATAQLAVCIVGGPETSRFELVDFPLPESLHSDLAQRGMRFVGILGLVQGAPRVALAEPLADEVMQTLSDAFVRRVADILDTASKQNGDSVEWLEKLHALPDTRD